jgi:hypothetical protein
VRGSLPCHLLSQCHLLHLIITPSINKLLHVHNARISGSQHSLIHGKQTKWQKVFQGLVLHLTLYGTVITLYL